MVSGALGAGNGFMRRGSKCTTMRAQRAPTYLLHDTSLALGEGDVPTRLVLDELDLNLSSLAAGLVIIVVVVAARARLTPRFSMPMVPLPSSWTDGDAFWSCSVISLAMVVSRDKDWLPAVFGGRGP